MTEPQQISQFQRWMMGARPKTLPASMSPVLVGWGLSIYTGSFSVLSALAALLVAVMIQIGTNLINDVIDFIRGTDNAERLGPVRVTQSGLLSPRQVWSGVAVSYGIAGLAGLYLFFNHGWIVLGIGLLCMLAGFMYSWGPYAMSRTGLGDLFAILFFGFAGVGGTVLVTAGQVTFSVIPASVSVGVLVANILIVNNIRDIETDRRAGRINIAIRFGRAAAELEYGIFLVAAYSAILAGILWGLLPPTTFLTLASVPMAWNLFRTLRAAPAGRELNIYLASTARFLLIFSVLLGVGIACGRLFLF